MAGERGRRGEEEEFDRRPDSISPEKLQTTLPSRKEGLPRTSKGKPQMLLLLQTTITAKPKFHEVYLSPGPLVHHQKRGWGGMPHMFLVWEIGVGGNSIQKQKQGNASVNYRA